jgi:hypothetical protein
MLLPLPGWVSFALAQTLEEATFRSTVALAQLNVITADANVGPANATAPERMTSAGLITATRAAVFRLMITRDVCAKDWLINPGLVFRVKLDCIWTAAT